MQLLTSQPLSRNALQTVVTPNLPLINKPLRQLRVLAVEDNTVNRLVLNSLLKHLGITPDLVNDGSQAVAAVRQSQSPFDMILMDCEMPIMNGLEASQAIRQFERQENLPSTPIIALTSHSASEYRNKVFEAGMNHCLTKPITQQTLTKTLERWITH